MTTLGRQGPVPRLAWQLPQRALPEARRECEHRLRWLLRALCRRRRRRRRRKWRRCHNLNSRLCRWRRTYQGDPEERRHIICRPQGLRPLEEFCVCIDFHNVLDLGNGGRFLAVDQRTVGALRELLVDCAPVRLHICSFSGRAQAQHYWEENIIPCLD